MADYSVHYHEFDAAVSRPPEPLRHEQVSCESLPPEVPRVASVRALKCQIESVLEVSAAYTYAHAAQAPSGGLLSRSGPYMRLYAYHHAYIHGRQLSRGGLAVASGIFVIWTIYGTMPL